MTAYPSDHPVTGLRIQRHDHRDVVVLTVHGELDVASAPELRDALRQAIGERPRQRVVVDLEAVELIDSAGLGVLVGALKRVRDNDGDLVLVATATTCSRCSSSPG